MSESSHACQQDVPILVSADSVGSAVQNSGKLRETITARALPGCGGATETRRKRGKAITPPAIGPAPAPPDGYPAGENTGGSNTMSKLGDSSGSPVPSHWGFAAKDRPRGNSDLAVRIGLSTCEQTEMPAVLPRNTISRGRKSWSC